MTSEAVIIRRCQSGELNQLEHLVYLHGRRLYGLCRKLTGTETEADDLYQDTWLRALDSINRFQAGNRFLPWLFTICLNRYRDRYRKRKSWSRRLVKPQDDNGLDLLATDPAPGADQQLAETEEMDRLRRAVNRLDDSIRIPLILYYYRDFTITEIAAMIGTPEGTVKSRLSRARKLLKAVLEDDHA